MNHASDVFTCMYGIYDILYSDMKHIATVQRETFEAENFVNFAVLWQFAKVFSTKFEDMASFDGTSEQSVKFFLRKNHTYFSLIHKLQKWRTFFIDLPAYHTGTLSVLQSEYENCSCAKNFSLKQLHKQLKIRKVKDPQSLISRENILLKIRDPKNFNATWYVQISMQYML